VVSLGTSTGFGTADFDRWPNALRYLLVIMMFVGGCAGSTAGGIKVIRILVLFKALGAELQRFVFPNRVRSIRLGGQIVNEDMMRNALAFFFLTLIIFSAGASALMFMGVDMESALTGVAATLFNIGPGLGSVGSTQNFADIPSAGKGLLSALMILGRLELFTAVVLLCPSFYKD
jgi:trk system potassium uptake protein TrkH